MSSLTAHSCDFLFWTSEDGVEQRGFSDIGAAYETHFGVWRTRDRGKFCGGPEVDGRASGVLEVAVGVGLLGWCGWRGDVVALEVDWFRRYDVFCWR